MFSTMPHTPGLSPPGNTQFKVKKAHSERLEPIHTIVNFLSLSLRKNSQK